MNAQVFSQRVRPTRAFQPHGGKVLIEKAGYISAKERIENIIAAGARLLQTRAEMYDFKEGEEIDEDFFDPTRSKGYDMADAFQDGLQVSERLKKAEREAVEKKKVLNDAKNDQYEQGSAISKVDDKK